MTEPFSVLLPVYRGDRAPFFERAVASVTAEQTRRPDELVIVVDGPVPDAIADVLRRVEAGELTGGVPTRVLALPENVGLARALEAGLDACAHEVVARADADDISLPRRFEVQLPLIEGGLDLVGSAIVEFGTEDGPDQMVRALPVSQAEIAEMARFRDPFNHPSVVYRRSAVRAAGGYEHLDKMEDYWLFARMIAAGAAVANSPRCWSVTGSAPAPTDAAAATACWPARCGCSAASCAPASPPGPSSSATSRCGGCTATSPSGCGRSCIAPW
ncbi:glycosyltransferase [Propioniciclava coleopterorum]|uniref:glycosyltransferase n=1 Tax=Propioniciclava coleopterorum TaxID=2714937 RepID=UPI001FE61656|nr:glycosyltransferase [Propioniciclava coleopterorum]